MMRAKEAREEAIKNSDLYKKLYERTASAIKQASSKGYFSVNISLSGMDLFKEHAVYALQAELESLGYDAVLHNETIEVLWVNKEEE